MCTRSLLSCYKLFSCNLRRRCNYYFSDYNTCTVLHTCWCAACISSILLCIEACTLIYCTICFCSNYNYDTICVLSEIRTCRSLYSFCNRFVSCLIVSTALRCAAQTSDNFARNRSVYENACSLSALLLLPITKLLL